MDSQTPPDSKPTFSTPVILALMLSIYTWLGTFYVIFFSANDSLRLIVLASSLALSGLVRFVGRDEITNALKHGGQIKLSGFQSILVTIMVISIGITIPWITGLIPPPQNP